MNNVHPRFIAGLDAIQKTLQIEKPADPDYRDILWNDLKKYWNLSEESVLHAMNDFRLNNIFKHYPKIGELKPLIEKRLFPTFEDAYYEACQHAGSETHEWSHVVVRESARQIGSSDLKGGSVGSQKAVKARFENRYLDTCESYIRGAKYTFDRPQIEFTPVSDMSIIKEWCKKHQSDESSPEAWRLFYVTKKGDVAKMMRDKAEKAMKLEPWWNHYFNSTGKEPQLPPAPMGF